MRVLQSCHRWLPITQRWIWIQIRYLSPGIESSVVASAVEDAGRHPWPDVRIARFAGRETDALPRRLGRVLRRRFLRQAARETGAVLVHSHFGNMGWEDSRVAKASGLRHVVTFYGYDVARLPQLYPAWRRRYRRLFDSVDRVLCEGPYMARSVAKLGCPEAKLRVQHLGVELDRMAFAARRFDPSEPLRVLMAASFIEKKGIPLGVRAVARLARTRPVRLTLIGDAAARPESQLEKRHILEAIAAEGLERDVRMLGYQPHEVLAREMAEHHLFLQPSVHAADGDCEGGAPVSLIEAAASGMAIVSTTHCDIPEVVRHGETGWLAAERDLDGLVQGLEWWASQSDWERVLTASRRRIEAEFDAVTQGRRLAAIYDELVAPAATRSPAAERRSDSG